MNLCKKTTWIFCTNFLAGIMIIIIYAAESKRCLIFAGDMNYPPFESIIDGQPIGINVDILSALSKAMHKDIEIQLMNGAEAQQMLKEDKVDALTEMAYTESRAELFDFSEPTVMYKYSFFMKKYDKFIHAFIIILFIGFWIYTLKRQLKSKTADLQKAHDNLEGDFQERTNSLQREIEGHKNAKKNLLKAK